MIQPLDTIFLVLLIICAIAALEASDLLAAVILFGAFSFFAAMLYAIMGALDVAFTEAALGAVIATVFFVSAIGRSQFRSKQ
ncbi:MAG: hydrogenase subunit MbhD domain-containing protein [Elusimicrobiota bacterium]